MIDVANVIYFFSIFHLQILNCHHVVWIGDTKEMGEISAENEATATQLTRAKRTDVSQGGGTIANAILPAITHCYSN